MGFWDKVKEQYKADLNKAMKKKIKLDYLGGHPAVKGKEVQIMQGEEPRQIVIGKTVLHVQTIDWQEKHERSGGKAAAGAIIGGLATGGLGAIAGAAIGGRKKDKSTAVIVAEEGYTLYVRCGQDEYKELTALL